MQPSGVITFTTDFGHKGPFAGVMKGVILRRFPAASIVDLGHDIPAHWPPEAGFWISRSYEYFPEGSVHLAIVDPGVGTERRILIVEHDAHVFMAPDNGLLEPLLSAPPESRVYALDLGRLDALKLATPSLTFHGRDIFAPVAAEIAAGRLAPRETGPLVNDWAPGWIDAADTNVPGRVSGAIITIDSFGNLISNIDEAMLAGMDSPAARIGGHSFDLRPTYGRATPGDYLALINSFGVVEVARAEGSAADGLGIERGAPIVVSDASAD